MKTIMEWLDQTENLCLLLGSMIFALVMIGIVSLPENVINVFPMVILSIASVVFFYFTIYYARQADRTLQEKKFLWRRFTFGLVILIAACTAGLLYNGTLGKVADIYVHTVCVVSSTFGVIVIVSALKRIHLPNRTDKDMKA